MANMPNLPTYRSSMLLDRLEDTVSALRDEPLTLVQLDSMFLSIETLMKHGYAQMRRISEEYVAASEAQE